MNSMIENINKGGFMKYLLPIFLLLFQCAVWYPCNIVNVQKEMCKELIKIDTTHNTNNEKYKLEKLEKHIRELYKWKTRKCNCYDKYPER